MRGRYARCEFLICRFLEVGCLWFLRARACSCPDAQERVLDCWERIAVFPGARDRLPGSTTYVALPGILAREHPSGCREHNIVLPGIFVQVAREHPSGCPRTQHSIT